MYFGNIPPETNSDKIYSEDSDPMRAAAAKWDAVGETMKEISYSFKRVLTWLDDGVWSGPSATKMAEAAGRYRTWLRALAKDMDQTTDQVFAILNAYGDARASSVRPDVIAHNRARLETLIQDNEFGDNSDEIAYLEKQYQEFWAKDVTAMDTYATNVLDALSKLTPWPEPPEIIDEAGLVEEAAKV